MIEEKFEGAASLLKEHNAVIGEGKPGYVNSDGFISNLKLAGGTSEERLKSFSWDEILNLLPTASCPVKPIALAKELANLFRGTGSGSGKQTVSVKKADKMSVRELVEVYDPEDSDNAIGKRLKDISKGNAFIVFSSGHTVDVDTTVMLLLELKKGFPPRTDIQVNNKIKPVYVVGYMPDNYADENPLYGRPLRPDGTCDQTGRSWSGVDKEVRQLIKVARDIGELVIDTLDKAHSTLDLAILPDAMAKLRQRYRKASIKFDELEKTHGLPLLQVKLGANGKKLMENAKKVEWR